MKTTALLLMLLSFAGDGFAQTAAVPETVVNPYDLPDGLYAEITTPRGIVVCELYFKKTPMTVASYVGLAEGTLGPEPRRPFFDTSTYHRIVPGYVAQGGAAQPRGRGGPGYSFPDEFVPGLRHDAVGVLQMANAGPGTNGSQHCLMLGPAQRLNYLHTVFGRVVRGIEALPNIERGDSMRVKILRIGADAKAFRADDAAFQALVANAKAYEGPPRPGPDAFFDDPDGLLPTDVARALHFNFKLANFARFTDERIIARLLGKVPGSGDEAALDAYLQQTAARLGVAERGALVIYIAAGDRWLLHVGPESAASFIAGPRGADGSKPPAVAGKTLDEATQEFLAATQERAAELVEKAANAPPPNDSLSPPQRLKLHVDAVLDELIFRLEPE